MSAEERIDKIELFVVTPLNDEDVRDAATATCPDIFGDDADHTECSVTLTRIIGGVTLHAGHVLEALGNTKAHKGSEVRPRDITIKSE